MGKYDETEKKDSGSRGPHPDYETNLHTAHNFMAKVVCRSGISLAITGSHGLERSLFMISWNPGRYAPMGRFANPICLHQSKDTFSKSLEHVFNDYVRRAEGFEKKFGPIKPDD